MIRVLLSKRYLQKRKRNGQREWRWVLRWESPDGWRCESTGTADRTIAESMQKAKLLALNSGAEEAAPVINASWQECKEALERAMKADNLRPGYVSDALLMFECVRKTFPKVKTPADLTHDHANEFKRLRHECGNSAWSTKGDLATLRAVFGKWLVRECGLLTANPFENVRPPKCDDPEIRIVAAAETKSLFKWLDERWNSWRLPRVYLEVAALVGWRATEIASIREDDLLPDGYVRVIAESSKTRKHKYAWLPPDLYAELKACAAGGFAFGRFSDELRRLLMLWKRRPHHAAMVKEFTPKRLVCWLQDELKRFNDDLAAAAKKANLQAPESFSLHDFRRTAITGLQMSGASEKETSLTVGCTPEVIRKHYEKMDAMVVAKRAIQRRLNDPAAQSYARLLRAADQQPLDDQQQRSQTGTA